MFLLNYIVICDINRLKFFLTVQPIPRGDHVLNFSDAEDMQNDEDIK